MSILKVSIRQIKAARALLDWSQADLAEKSGISEPTIKRLEAGDGDTLGGRAKTAQQIIETLELAGAVFMNDDYSGQGGPGVRLRDK